MKLTSVAQAKIYLITPEIISNLESFYTKTEEALSAGIRVLQFRNKLLSKRDAYHVSIRLRKLTRQYQSLFIINDEIDLALASNADGVHVGQEDFPLHWTRKLIGRDKILGVSTHSLTQAIQAEEGGADYIGFGAIFPTSTKENTVEVGLENLKALTENISIPVIAIGGITISNIASVFNRGASGVAMISSVWDQENIKDALIRLHQQIKEITGEG